MQYSTNFNMTKPELNEQYRLSHWNDNTDIIDTEMQAIRSGTDEVMKATLLNFCYPIGSLYWSSKSTDPSTLFGGTWVQIKDRFVLACGDTYKTVGATGGASSVTLSVSNMPNHSHSFTPSGEVTSTFTGTAVNTGGMSANERHTHTVNLSESNWGSISNYYCYIDSSQNSSSSLNNKASPSINTASVAHTHSVTAKGTVSSSFTGYGGTTSPEGSGSAFNILPPYVVKYCWERTA